MSYNLPDEKGHFDQYGGIFVADVGGAHVDLGTKRERGGPRVAVEDEQDALPLSEHAEHRAIECTVGQIELGQVGISDHDAVARSRVV